ncbi:integral membrane protein [Rutstroemia sp. NJR-2017a BBW]|nr:integral membrane protein [Rutstroemia sp. NJR-2017a BBW]
MHRSILLLVSTLLPVIISAQQLQDGAIVPFQSDLPSCASQCGPLSDVQGACTPPAKSTTDSSCFCSDSRLTPFLQGTSGVSSVCGAASCTSSTDLQTIESWYESYCNVKSTTGTTTSSSSSSTGTSSSSNSSSNSGSGKPVTWFSSHWKWVVMLIVLVLGITAAWVLAAFFRRRYLRKREREIEMRPPVALGPHQVQGMTGGYKYGDGIVNAADGGHHKDAARSTVTATPADATRGKRESNLQKKSRK